MGYVTAWMTPFLSFFLSVDKFSHAAAPDVIGNLSMDFVAYLVTALYALHYLSRPVYHSVVVASNRDTRVYTAMALTSR
jgi:hypothetical protein